MPKTIRKFDFEHSGLGVRIVAATLDLSADCVSASEIDGYIRALKEDLDATGLRAKAALSRKHDKPLGLKVSPDA